MNRTDRPASPSARGIALIPALTILAPGGLSGGRAAAAARLGTRDATGSADQLDGSRPAASPAPPAVTSSIRLGLTTPDSLAFESANQKLDVASHITGASATGLSGAQKLASITFEGLGHGQASMPLQLTAVTLADPSGATLAAGAEVPAGGAPVPVGSTETGSGSW